MNLPLLHTAPSQLVPKGEIPSPISNGIHQPKKMPIIPDHGCIATKVSEGALRNENPPHIEMVNQEPCGTISKICATWQSRKSPKPTNPLQGRDPGCLRLGGHHPLPHHPDPQTQGAPTQLGEVGVWWIHSGGRGGRVGVKNYPHFVLK